MKTDDLMQILHDKATRGELIKRVWRSVNINLLYINSPPDKVGRRCLVVRQDGKEIVLSFQSRIGPPDDPDGVPRESGPSPDVIEIE